MREQKNQIQNDENGGAAAADGALSDSALEQVAGGSKPNVFKEVVSLLKGSSPSQAVADATTTSTATPSQGVRRPG